jgi:hypothetical protein
MRQRSAPRSLTRHAANAASTQCSQRDATHTAVFASATYALLTLTANQPHPAASAARIVDPSVSVAASWRVFSRRQGRRAAKRPASSPATARRTDTGHAAATHRGFPGREKPVSRRWATPAPPTDGAAATGIELSRRPCNRRRLRRPHAGPRPAVPLLASQDGCEATTARRAKDCAMLRASIRFADLTNRVVVERASLEAFHHPRWADADRGVRPLGASRARSPTASG